MLAIGLLAWRSGAVSRLVEVAAGATPVGRSTVPQPAEAESLVRLSVVPGPVEHPGP
jgi:hypothetical protein